MRSNKVLLLFCRNSTDKSNEEFRFLIENSDQFQFSPQLAVNDNGKFESERVRATRPKDIESLLQVAIMEPRDVMPRPKVKLIPLTSKRVMLDTFS